MWARIGNGVVLELTSADPSERWHPSIEWRSCPDSVSVGDSFDGTTYGPPPPPSPVDLERQRLAADRSAAFAYAKLVALSEMSPAQVQAFVAANVTNLAQAQDAIATLAVGLSILIRRERRGL